MQPFGSRRAPFRALRPCTPFYSGPAFAITVADGGFRRAIGMRWAPPQGTQFMPELKLFAFDADDLAVISANLQDALLRVGDLAWLPAQQRFVAVCNRFDWVDALKSTGNASAQYLRRRAGLRFERARAAQISGIDLQRKE